MPERFEIYIVYKRRYVNNLPFLSFFLFRVAYVRSQRQYRVLSEDRHRLVVTRDLDF